MRSHRFLKLTSIILLSMFCFSCGKNSNEGVGVYTYNTYTSISPSNWNIFTYMDANDSSIIDYVNGSFFNYDFEFDENGNVVERKYKNCFDAVTSVVDLTTTYAGNPDYSVPDDATQGYAYKFVLRKDLKWDDGTKIDANDFIYTFKELINPLFQNYRADELYMGTIILHNAFGYLKQGISDYFQAFSIYATYDTAYDSELVWSVDNSAPVATYIREYLEAPASMSSKDVWDAILDSSAEFSSEQACSLDGKTISEIKSNTTLKDTLEKILEWFEEGDDGILSFTYTYSSFPKMDFSEVGAFVGDNNYEFILVLDKPLVILDDQGNLTYRGAYGTPCLLVKKDLYEKCKIAPNESDGLWTSNYCSSVETTASWGPYKLTKFQPGKTYVLEKNPYWYGYNDEVYKGQYQTDRIVSTTIESSETAWLSFKKGDLDSIAISVANNNEQYKNSSRAYFTASDFVGSLNIQSNASALKNREKSGIDKEILSNVKFREALSLGINRSAYLQATSVASKPSYGLFNSQHYYDVENGKTYRNEDIAKKVILDVYDISYTEANLDLAYEAVTGYDPKLAKKLINEAYDEEIAAGRLNQNDKVQITFGSSVDDEAERKVFEELNKQFVNLAVGTKLEGKIELVFDASFGTKWASDFMNGAYDIMIAGWTGAAFDPAYLLGAYVDSNYMYSSGWDTSADLISFNPNTNLPGDPDIGEIEISVLDWYLALNGMNSQYNFSSGIVSETFRMGIVAEVEKAVLKKYYTVPIYSGYSAELVSYKVDYITTTYNTFMGYGGMRYLSYNYDDAEWAKKKTSFDYLR